MCIWISFHKRLAVKKTYRQAENGRRSTKYRKTRSAGTDRVLSCCQQPEKLKFHIQPCLQGPTRVMSCKVTESYHLRVFFVSKSCQTRHVNIYSGRFCRKPQREFPERGAESVCYSLLSGFLSGDSLLWRYCSTLIFALAGCRITKGPAHTGALINELLPVSCWLSSLQLDETWPSNEM